MTEKTTLLINSLEILEHDDEAFATMGLNPTLTWVKFILTDDKPNNNGQRVPKEEFKNLISSGLYMPIKMTEGEIGGHHFSRPIGVITHLKEKADKIVGLAALWGRENPDDVTLIKERYAEGESLDLSWEILFKNYTESEEGIKELHGTVLKAATLVEVPAYGGRTFITEVASTKDKEETTLDEIKKLQAGLEDMKEKLEQAETKIKKLEKENTELKDSQLTEELQNELASLREFKSDIDAEIERQERLEKIQEKFAAAGIPDAEKYIEGKEDALLQIGDDGVELLVDTVKKAKEEAEEEEEEKPEGEEKPEDDEASKEKKEEGEEKEDEEASASIVPNFKGKNNKNLEPSDLARLFRKMETRK